MVRGAVSLNTVGYQLASLGKDALGKDIFIRRARIEPFADAFRPDGQQTQTAIQTRSSRTFSKLTVGLGLNHIAATDSEDPFSYRRFHSPTTASTIFPGDVRLPILEEGANDFGMAEVSVFVSHLSDFYGVGANTDSNADVIIRKFVGSTGKWDAPSASAGELVFSGAGDALALDSITHKGSVFVLAAHQDDQLLFVSANPDATDFAATAQTLDTADLADSVTAGESIDAGLMVEIPNEIVVATWDEDNLNLKFYHSNDRFAANKVLEGATIPAPTGIKGITVMIGTDGLQKIITMTDDGLWETDVATSGSWVHTRILPGSFTPNADNGRRMTVTGDGALWVSQGVDDDSPVPIRRLLVNDAKSWELQAGNGLDVDDGVSATELGTVRWMTAVQDFLFISVGGGKASRQGRIFGRQVSDPDGGWHSIRQHDTANEQIQAIGFSGQDDGVPRLHYAIRTSATKSEMKFLRQPLVNPSSGVSINREASGILDLPDTDGGILTPKAFLEVLVDAADLTTTAGEFIEIRHGLDGALRSDTDLGDAISTDKDVVYASGAGESGLRDALRLTLNRDANTIPVAFDAATIVNNINAFSHTCSGSNRLLIVGVATEDATTTDPTGVTYNSVAMTKEASGLAATVRVTMWSLIAPASGANDVEVTLGFTADRQAVSAVSFTGVDQTTALGTPITTDYAPAPSGIVNQDEITAIREMLVDVLGWDVNAVGSVTGVNQTQQTQSALGGGGARLAMSTLPSVGLSGTVGWSGIGSVDAIHISAAIKPADTGSTITDTPKLRSATISYLPVPNTLERFTFQVDIKATANLNSTSPEEVLTNLNTARDSSVLVAFDYGNAGSTFVRVKDIQVQEVLASPGGAVLSAPDPNVQRTGIALVVCENVI